MQVKYRRTTLWGSVNVETEAYTTQVEGAAILNACIDKSGVVAGTAGNAIRLKSVFGRFEALFILGGRQSIIESLRLQGTSPVIMNDTGSEALYAWFFRKKHSFGKNQTLVVICAGKTAMRPGGWDATERIDLRYGLENPYSTPYGEVTPARLADICERMLYGKAA